MNRILFLFTQTYPFGKGETFLENEFPFLLEHFDQIHIITENSQDEQTRPVANKVIIHRITPILSTFKKFSIITLFSNKVFLEEVNWIYRNKKKNEFLSCIKIAADFYLKALAFNRKIKAILVQNKIKEAIFYTYWLDKTTLASSLLAKNTKRFKVISRVHGYDLYFERHPYNYLPFRQFLLANLDSLYSISENGINYLHEKFNANAIQLARLGTINTLSINPIKSSTRFTIISCSSMIPLKRIQLVIDALALLNIPFYWMHIGVGTLEKQLIQQAKTKLKQHQYNFLGYLDNKEVLNIYKQQQPSIFINTSETEGIPVSMMEAMSFDIPCIGTNVGGVAEIIQHEYNGYLLTPNPTPQEIANQIFTYYQLPKNQQVKFRANARETWNKKYNAERNYNQFIQNILSL